MRQRKRQHSRYVPVIPARKATLVSLGMTILTACVSAPPAQRSSATIPDQANAEGSAGTTTRNPWGLTADKWGAVIEAEAKRICAEAPVLHYERSRLEALYLEREALWDELRTLAERNKEQFEAIDRKMERARLAGDSVGLASALQQSSTLLSSHAYRRVMEIPMVVDELDSSCIWPVEDQQDDDPRAIEARRIERERLRRKQYEIRSDMLRGMLGSPLE